MIVSHDPPWRLDPFQNIVGVGWGSADVLVLRIDTSVKNHSPHPTTIEGLHFTTAVIYAYAETIREHDADADPEPRNPMTSEMRAHAFMWNCPPHKLDTGGDEPAHTWSAIIFLNLSRIRSFFDSSDSQYFFTIRFPAAERDLTNGTIYWAFADPFGNPFEYYREHPATTGAVIDSDGHTGIVTTPIAFGGGAQRDVFLGWNAGSLPPWHVFDEALPDSDANDGLRWKIRGRTYKKRIDFATDLQNVPLWDEFEGGWRRRRARRVADPYAHPRIHRHREN